MLLTLPHPRAGLAGPDEERDSTQYRPQGKAAAKRMQQEHRDTPLDNATKTKCCTSKPRLSVKYLTARRRKLAVWQANKGMAAV